MSFEKKKTSHYLVGYRGFILVPNGNKNLFYEILRKSHDRNPKLTRFVVLLQPLPLCLYCNFNFRRIFVTKYQP